MVRREILSLRSFSLALLFTALICNNPVFASGFDFPLGKPDASGYGVQGLGGLDFLDLYLYPDPCG